MTAKRPQELYRARLHEEVRALLPLDVLEVGCGSGTFLRAAADLGARLAGIDPDEAAVAALRAEGFDVSRGNAEKLEFAAGSFDAVVFCYTAHHIRDWSSALREASRVARRAIFILDPWYDVSMASQRASWQFDCWCKAIDRASGMVHEDCLSAAQLLAPLSSTLEAYEVGITHWLHWCTLSPDRLHTLAEAQLAKIQPAETWRAKLETIRQAGAEGFSEDGAIFASLRKRGAPS